jgi:hypothetical protein
MATSLLPAKSITIKIGENEYEVKFPNNGQIIDMETMKINLTKDTHRSMLFNVTASAERAYLTVEAIVTFSVLIPKLKDDLVVKSLLDLDPYQSKQLVKAYSEQFYPWFKQWMDIVNEDDEVKDAGANP